jgi:hypothetical protein
MPQMPVHILIGLLILWALYITPTVIAFRRGHPNRWMIAMVNVVFGATLFGWFFAMAWSLQAVHLSSFPGGSDGGESGLNVFVNDVQQVRVVAEDPTPVPNPFTGNGSIDMRAAVEELDRLKKLRLEGDLTQQQFEALKAILLKRVV